MSARAMLQLSFELSWTTLPLFLTLFCGYVTPAGAVLGAVLLAIKRTRQFWPTRWLGFLCLAIAFVFAMGPVLWMAETGAYMGSEKLSELQRTRKLTADQEFAGTVFPAGSTLLLAPGEQVPESGTLSRPTRLHGFLITGSFTQNKVQDWSERNLTATLMEPATVEGLACAPGHFYRAPDAVSCRLAQEVTLDGFPLAAGTVVQINRIDKQALWFLAHGVLARPETIFDAVWPSGTVLDTGGSKLNQLAHPRGDLSGMQVLCLPAGDQLVVRGSTIHGPFALAFGNEETEARGACLYAPDGADDPGKQVPGWLETRDGRRIVSGSQETPTSVWMGDEVHP